MKEGRAGESELKMFADRIEAALVEHFGQYGPLFGTPHSVGCIRNVVMRQIELDAMVGYGVDSEYPTFRIKGADVRTEVDA